MSTTPRSGLSTIQSKAVRLSVQEVKLPDPSTDVLTLFKSNTAAGIATSNEWTIDVFPNMVPILMYVMLVSRKHAAITQQSGHSMSSVATICMYHMSIVYGFFPLNDLYVRPSPSAHARNWAELSWKHDFSNFLLSLPMPEFLAPILSQFHSFQTERTKNVFFIPSAAGYDHNQFFGRVFPLNMFAAIHDYTATLSGNSTRNQVLQDLYSRVLYTITAPNFVCVIPDLIGITIDQTLNTTANYMNSKLYRVFNAVFNPLLFRDTQRHTLAALSFIDPTFSTNHVNAYDLLFSVTPANIHGLKVVLQAVSAFICKSVPCKMTLSQFISEASIPQILKHGYCTYPLPTWSHSENATKSNLFAGITVQHLVSEDERAQDICFLQRPNAAIACATELNDVFYTHTGAPNTPVNLPANHVIASHLPFSLRLRQAAENGFPRHDNNDLVQFSDEVDTAPRILVLDTDGNGILSAHLPLLAGKIVESFELDGSTIEIPNAQKSLGMQNCMFADSAIGYNLVRPGSSFRPRAANAILPPLNRAAPNSLPCLPASSLLHDRTKVMLPQVNPTIHEAKIPAGLPGFTLRTPVNVLRCAQSFLGFRPSMAHQMLLIKMLFLVWPKVYCWFGPPTPTLLMSRTTILPQTSALQGTNLRTFFGTVIILFRLSTLMKQCPLFRPLSHFP